MLTLNVNGTEQKVQVEPDMPLLWALRDYLALSGTKYSCGIGICGACLVSVDGWTLPSCMTPVSAVVGKKIVTIEG